MPDITMCRGGECPLKNRCYRYTASPDEYQSYFVEIPGAYTDENLLGGKLETPAWKCNMFWGEIQNDILDQLNKIVQGQ